MWMTRLSHPAVVRAAPLRIAKGPLTILHRSRSGLIRWTLVLAMVISAIVGSAAPAVAAGEKTQEASVRQARRYMVSAGAQLHDLLTPIPPPSFRFLANLLPHLALGATVTSFIGETTAEAQLVGYLLRSAVTPYALLSGGLFHFIDSDYSGAHLLPTFSARIGVDWSATFGLVLFAEGGVILAPTAAATAERARAAQLVDTVSALGAVGVGYRF